MGKAATRFDTTRKRHDTARHDHDSTQFDSTEQNTGSAFLQNERIDGKAVLETALCTVLQPCPSPLATGSLG